MTMTGRTEQSEATIEVLKTIEAPLGKVAISLVQMASYAATGNVLQIQQLLQAATDHLDPEKESDLHQAMSVIGVALVAMGEDVGSAMALRHFNHLMHYGEPVVRRAVPLALGLISASNPVTAILETLSRYSHDNDLEVALNAIFAMGLVGAGTNNAKLAQMLRQLASYYAKEPDCLFMVRIAQGLVHMGKGTIGVNPFHTDRSLVSPVAVCGLLATLVAFTDTRAFVLDKSHWMLYFLTMAMYPRFLITLDDQTGDLLPTSVRVGQAVDVVGQAGKPRTISGFQTHTTPVRLGHTERAEMATEEFIPYSHVLEGCASSFPRRLSLSPCLLTRPAAPFARVSRNRRHAGQEQGFRGRGDGHGQVNGGGARVELKRARCRRRRGRRWATLHPRKIRVKPLSETGVSVWAPDLRRSRVRAGARRSAQSWGAPRARGPRGSQRAERGLASPSRTLCPEPGRRRKLCSTVAQLCTPSWGLAIIEPVRRSATPLEANHNPGSVSHGVCSIKPLKRTVTTATVLLCAQLSKSLLP